MLINRPKFRWSLCVAVVALIGLCTSSVFARGGAGAMMRIARAEAKWMQQQMAAYQKQQKEQYDAFMARFDTNKNGKIDGKEKGPAKKYLRDIEMGRDPDKAVRTLGRTSKSK